MRTQTRRTFLRTVAGAGVVGSAGCLGTNTTARESAATLASASFFVFGDVAANVAGDEATAETLVPIGQHGHGWEPGPDVQGRILESDIFVHGMPSFQPWADDVLTSLDADGADIVTVDAAADVDLHEAGPDGHVHDEDGDEHGHDDETDGESHDDESASETTNGSIDPHFWMDPRRVVTATETLRDAFQSVDGANADAYAANAESYRESLLALDSTFETALESRERDVILVAGHDAFGYLGDRYDVDVVALSGISPDDSPSPRDIERAQVAIEEHGIRHVLADPLESDRAATQLVAETDAEAVLPLTSIPGVTSEWRDAEWGYVDIMRETNLPSLVTALDAR